jgi:hypothetical protein
MATTAQRATGLAAAVWLIVVIAWPATATAYISLPREPAPNKVAIADCVVVGKVTASQPEPVSAHPYRQQATRLEFMVVTMAVRETLFGPRQAQVRMGFICYKVRSGEYKSVATVGQEGCFFGVKCDQDFYVVPSGCFLDSRDPDYDKDVALARRCARMLDDPGQWLKSKEAGDRLLAACMLVLRYTYAPLRWGGQMKGEPVDAEHSKLILLALADADWTTPDPSTGLSPRNMVGWLMMSTVRTGVPWPKTWPRPIGPDADAIAAQKQWLRDHAGTHRIQRLVLARPDTPAGSQPDSAPPANPPTRQP